MLLMMLGEVVFGGTGCGLYGMLGFAIMTVFIAGLMVGRTPEYLGKKIEGREMKLTALCIIIHPLLILADEPTGALDSKTGREVLDFLKQLHEEGNTVVIITHDNSIAVEAERVVKISDGKIIFDGDVKAYESIL